MLRRQWWCCLEACEMLLRLAQPPWVILLSFGEAVATTNALNALKSFLRSLLTMTAFGWMQSPDPSLTDMLP